MAKSVKQSVKQLMGIEPNKNESEIKKALPVLNLVRL